MDGEYPKVRACSPRRPPTYAVVATTALTEAVKRVSLVAERNTPVRLSFTDGVITLEAGQGEDAQASEAVEAGLVGDDLAVAFNPQFLLDGLAALGAPVRPALVHGRQQAGRHLRSGRAGRRATTPATATC